MGAREYMEEVKGKKKPFFKTIRGVMMNIYCTEGNYNRIFNNTQID